MENGMMTPPAPEMGEPTGDLSPAELMAAKLTLLSKSDPDAAKMAMEDIPKEMLQEVMVLMKDVENNPKIMKFVEEFGEGGDAEDPAPMPVQQMPGAGTPPPMSTPPMA